MTSSFIQRRMGRAHCSMAIAVNLVLIIAATAQPRDPERYQITVRSLEFGSPELVTYNLDGTNPRRFEPEGVDGHDPAWSPDGKKLVFGDDDQIVLLDLATLKRTILTSGPGYKHIPAWSPDGKQIAFLNSSNKGSRIWIVTPNRPNDPIRELFEGIANTYDPAWSPDGDTLAFNADSKLVIVDNDSHTLPTKGIMHGYRPAWSLDGRMIAFHRQRQIFVTTVPTTSVRQLTQNGGSSNSPMWSLDGRYIAYRYFIESPFSDQPRLPSGDLILFDVVNETHTTILKAKLTRLGSRPAWKTSVELEREKRCLP